MAYQAKVPNADSLLLLHIQRHRLLNNQHLLLPSWALSWSQKASWPVCCPWARKYSKQINQSINQSSSLWRRYKFYCCKPCYFYFCLFLFYKSLGVFFAIAWSAAGTSPIARNFPRFKSCAIAGYSTKPRTITSYCWDCSQAYYFNLLFNIVIILKHYYYNNIIWSCGLTNNNCPQ